MFAEINKFVKSNQQIIMVVFLIILAYFVLRTFYLGEEKIIEGLTNGTSVKETIEKIQEKLDSRNKSLNESLMLDKYKSDYENIIIAVDEIIDKEVVSLLAFELMGDKSSVDSIPANLIQKVNDMMQFKTNLNGIMDSLDKAADLSTSASSVSNKVSSSFSSLF